MEIPKITALVPMKGHSERVPNKNLRPVAGKPCFHWIMESLGRSPYIGEVVINTDSEEIAESARKNFEVTILERPDYLLGDMVSIQPLIAYDLSMTEGEYYLQTHSTNPLVTTETINNSIKTFFNQKEYDALFTVTPIKTRFYRADGSGVNHDPRRLIRTQDLDPIFEENSCLYIFSKETNQKTGNRLGSNPMMFPMDRLEAVDIDDMEDFYWADYLVRKKERMKGNNVVYLSHPYNGLTPSYGGQDQVRIEPKSSIDAGETANTSSWVFTNNHIGTHVDVPFHFAGEGKKVLDYSPDEWLYHKVMLVDVPCDTARLIEVSDLDVSRADTDIEMLLIRTGFEKFRFEDRYWNNNPGLSKDLPRGLRRLFPELRAIGFDFISVTSWKHRQVGRECHRALLSPTASDERPIIAIEDMSLSSVTGAINWILVSPLLAEDGNGAPVTVFADLKG